MTKNKLKAYYKKLNDLSKTINPMIGRVMPQVSPLDSLGKAFSNEVDKIVNNVSDSISEFTVQLQIKESDKAFDDMEEHLLADFEMHKPSVLLLEMDESLSLNPEQLNIPNEKTVLIKQGTSYYFLNKKKVPPLLNINSTILEGILKEHHIEFKTDTDIAYPESRIFFDLFKKIVEQEYQTLKTTLQRQLKIELNRKSSTPVHSDIQKKKDEVKKLYFDRPRCYIGREDKAACQKLYKDLTQTLSDIRQLEGEASGDLKKTLESTIRLNNYYDPLSFIWTNHELMPNESSYVDLTLQEVVDVLLPKTLILMHFDELLETATQKLAALIEKDKENNVQKSVIVLVAQDMVDTVLKARQSLIEAETVDGGLEKIKHSVSEVYHRHEAVFAKHRGIHKNSGEYDLINVMLDLFRGLTGLAVAVLTLPGWLWDPKGTKKFVGRFFERPQTASHHIFGKLQVGMESLSSIVDNLKPK